jgi:FAD/FMN-containing dehydrogenase
LRLAIQGAVVLPSDTDYERARLLYNTRFDASRPVAIARCASAADVRECVLFARRHGLPLAVRSGGHSYEGWSSGPGLVIDLRRMSAVEVREGSALIGAGAQLIDVYAALAAKGVGIPAGSCPTVGISGLTLGGGLGVVTRAWGMTCDALLEAEVVTADGTLRVCDDRRDPDLFWALRGAGAGNFGVVTSLTFHTRAVGRLALAFVQWESARARDVLRSWQEWVGSAPDELWSNVHLSARSGGDLEVAVHAVSLGDGAALGRMVDRLGQAVRAAPSYREVGTLPYMDAMLLESGCLGRSVAQCHLKGTTPEGALERETYAASSVIAGRPLTSEAIDALVAGIDRLRSIPNAGSGAVIVDALGGAVARVAPDATAFPHRSALASVQILASWGATAGAAVVDASGGWLRAYRDELRAHIGRGAYVGYPDADLPDWESAYYGASYARLQQVKAKYDPARVFTFPQAVRTP